jgi:hypothetical protein
MHVPVSRLFACVVALGVVAAACGSSDGDDDGSAGAAGAGAGTGGEAGARAGTGGEAGAGAGTGGEAGAAGRGGSTTDAGAGGDARGGTAGVAGSGGSGGDAGSGGNAGSGSVAPPTVEEFCPRFVDAFAGYMERCSCDDAAVTRYRELAASFCTPDGFLGQAVAAVAAGELLYDGVAALALFARLSEADPACVEETFIALKLDSVELYSLAGTFLGTRALGETCSHPVGYKGGISDCAEGVCATDGADAGVCIEFVAEGEECDGSGDDNFDSTVARLCHDVRLADPDGEYESAFDLLSCVAPEGGGGPRVCRPALPDGAECNEGANCASGLCVGSEAPGNCVAKLADGAPCEGHVECASGACTNSDPQVCGALLAEGEACSYTDTACESGFCNQLEGSGVCAPAPTQGPGEACALASDCTTRGHGNSGTGLCRNGVCIHDICAEYSE